MKIKYFEYICMYIPIVIVSMLLGVLARISVIAKGGDGFTGGIVFIVVASIGIIIYSGMTLFLHGICDIFIKFFPSKTKKTAATTIDFSYENDINSIREAAEKEMKIENESKLKIALDYTIEQFAPYVSDKGLKELTSHIVKYSEKKDLGNIDPIKVEKLTSIDIYHFGWNLWNHFDSGIQMDMAVFLKKVFADSLVESEVDTIKSHLRLLPNKGTITIKHTLSK